MKPDAHEIANMLADRIESLCRQLLPPPAGHYASSRSEWRIGSLAGEKGKSLSVRLKQRPGQWYDFCTGEHGDALDLVGAVLGYPKHDRAPALRWAREWLGIHTDARQRPQIDDRARDASVTPKGLPARPGSARKPRSKTPEKQRM